MRVPVALAAGGTIVAVALVVLLSASAVRVAGTNNTPPAEPVALIRPGQQACQREYVPADAASLRVAVPAVARGMVLSAGVREPPAPAALGRATRVRATLPVLPLPRRTAGPATVCVRNAGRRRVALLGVRAPPEVAVRVGGRAGRGRLHVNFLRAEPDSWAALASTVAERFELGKSELAGPWAAWAALALVLGAWALGALALLRSGSR